MDPTGKILLLLVVVAYIAATIYLARFCRPTLCETHNIPLEYKVNLDYNLHLFEMGELQSRLPYLTEVYCPLCEKERIEKIISTPA